MVSVLRWRVLLAGKAAQQVKLAHRDQEPDDFFVQLATHWKSHFDGWTAWILVPDMKLPGRMRLKESRRVPMWNGPIECRMFKFDIQGRRAPAAVAGAAAAGTAGAAAGAPQAT